MAVQEHYMRTRVITPSQHPLKHSAFDIGFTDDRLPGISTFGGALDNILAVLYPNSQDDVANVAALPAVGNTLRDYRVVLDDGDGKAAGYRWELREGEVSASWHKVYDFDWSTDGILSGFITKTQDLYVMKYGYDDIDKDGVPLTGEQAGQYIYGGASASTHLTLYANSGDGTGASTGFVQFGDHARPKGTTNLLDLGDSTHKFRTVYIGTSALVGTLTVAAGSITDSSGAISFDNENLTTTGNVTATGVVIGNGLVGTPALRLANSATTGLYRVGADELGVSAAGARVASFGAGWLDLVAGSVGAPSSRFAGDTTSGWYRSAADEVALSIAGTQRLKVSASGALWGGTNTAYVDFTNQRFGIGTASPSTDLHIFRSGQAVSRIESQNNTAANASTFQSYRSRTSGANVAGLDDLGYWDSYGMCGGAYTWLAGVQTRYRGDGTTLKADFIWATANLGAPAERMRLRYDGNLGIGTSDPTHVLHVVGDIQIDNLNFDGDTVSTSDTNGNLILAPNGTGWVSVSSKLLASADNSKDLGATGTRWANLYLSSSIGDGTNTIAMATLLSFRTALSGATSGMSLFYDGSTWNASLPDTEIDHGSISGLPDDDHTQYALLAGRSGGQTFYGGTAASNSLTLRSTSNATKGVVAFEGELQPFADATYDIGDASHQVKNFYISGQAIGLRVENYSTVGRPAAAAGTKGRMYYDTTTDDVYVDHGGNWVKTGVEKYVVQDASGWTGSVATVTYTVSKSGTQGVSDARTCVWAFKDNANSFEQLGVEITMTQTQVTVTSGFNLPAGTYTLVGVG